MNVRLESSGDRAGQNVRTSPLTMGLLWVTMVTAFPTVLIGVEWHKQGFSLVQVVACTLFAANLLLLYTVPAGMVGASTGKTFVQLATLVFGKHGCHFATIHVFWIFSAFYGMTALFMADAVTGLFHPPASMAVLSFVFALLMCLNNFWGFSGVVNFARYFAAPCMIIWVFTTFARVSLGLAATPLASVMVDGGQSWPVALTVIASFIIGFAAWGNEADYWRHGRPSVIGTALPVGAALMIGEVIFPITGWMVAHLFHLTDTAEATNFLNHFSFGGLAALACLVIGAQYFASQDSNIYGVVSAVESFSKAPRRIVVFAYGLVGGAIAVWLSISGLAKSLEAITSLNCVFLPGATVIIICEWFFCRYFAKGTRHLWQDQCESVLSSISSSASSSVSSSVSSSASSSVSSSASSSASSSVSSSVPSSLPLFYWPAITALLIGYAVGIATSGVIPGLKALHVGIPFLFAWFAGAASYLPLRLISHRRQCRAENLSLAGAVAVAGAAGAAGSVRAEVVDADH